LMDPLGVVYVAAPNVSSIFHTKVSRKYQL